MPSVLYATAALVLLAGCNSTPQPLAKTATFELHAVSPAKTPTTIQATHPDTGNPLFLATPAIITAADVATIQRSADPNQQPTLTVNLTPAGGKKLAAATTALTGQQIAIVIDGTIVTVPKVVVPITESFVITGGAIAKNREKLFKKLTGNEVVQN